MGTNTATISCIASETHLGRRTVQQDEYLVLPGFITHSEKTFHLLGVFDGHGSEGHKAAKAAKLEFSKVLGSRVDVLAEDPLAALKSAFHTVNESLLNDQSFDSYLSGTTAVVAFIVENILYVAHVGDSRLVIIKKGEEGLWTGTTLTE